MSVTAASREGAGRRRCQEEQACQRSSVPRQRLPACPDRGRLRTVYSRPRCAGAAARRGARLRLCPRAARGEHLQPLDRFHEQVTRFGCIAPFLHFHPFPGFQSANSRVPANISLLSLLPKAPELNPTKITWQCLRSNWLSNHVFASGRDIVDRCCDAWNKRTNSSSNPGP